MTLIYTMTNAIGNELRLEHFGHYSCTALEKINGTYRVVHLTLSQADAVGLANAIFRQEEKALPDAS